MEFQEEAIYLSGIEGILSSSGSPQEVFANLEGSTCKQTLTLLQDDSMLLTQTPILQASPLPTNPSSLTHLSQLNQLRNSKTLKEMKETEEEVYARKCRMFEDALASLTAASLVFPSVWG